MNLKKINFKQPKYMLPAIIYLPLIGLGWLVIDLFHTGKAEVPTSMETTEYLNPTLPEAQLKNDGIGGKYDNMTKSWGKIQDYSAVETIEQTEDPTVEEYNSKYSEEDLAYLDAAAEAQMQAEMERLRDLQNRLERSAEAGEAMAAKGNYPQLLTEEERLMGANKRQQESLDELNRALAEARQQGRNNVKEPESYPVMPEITLTEEVTKEVTAAVTEIAEDADAAQMVKKMRETSPVFRNETPTRVAPLRSVRGGYPHYS